MSRIAPENDLPVACSVCLQSPAGFSPKLQYVNFESAYDGPVIKDETRGPDEPGVYIEKIVICEQCVREGARLLGLDDIAIKDDHIANLEAHIDQLEAAHAGYARSISDLGFTVGVLIDHPIKRPAGRPQIQGPETHAEEVKETRAAQSKREQRRKKPAAKA